MNKEEEVLEIVRSSKIGSISCEEAAIRICLLFDVVGRSEQFCDYYKKPLENTCCNDCLEEMDSHNH